eukprot:TRINITY_DN62523_c1_g1_i1.p1 TRINITY_DN62523_c1_g1~~TRINITY_DN62523_c1_g1_i1.p1  ORF type:complete len:231 (-),score=22.79 TRINITY_DN62523_c1_g1_i1:87-779(-)
MSTLCGLVHVNPNSALEFHHVSDGVKSVSFGWQPNPELQPDWLRNLNKPERDAFVCASALLILKILQQDSRISVPSLSLDPSPNATPVSVSFHSPEAHFTLPADPSPAAAANPNPAFSSASPIETHGVHDMLNQLERYIYLGFGNNAAQVLATIDNLVNTAVASLSPKPPQLQQPTQLQQPIQLQPTPLPVASCSSGYLAPPPMSMSQPAMTHTTWGAHQFYGEHLPWLW